MKTMILSIACFLAATSAFASNKSCAGSNSPNYLKLNKTFQSLPLMKAENTDGQINEDEEKMVSDIRLTILQDTNLSIDERIDIAMIITNEESPADKVTTRQGALNGQIVKCTMVRAGAVMSVLSSTICCEKLTGVSTLNPDVFNDPNETNPFGMNGPDTQ